MNFFPSLLEVLRLSLLSYFVTGAIIFSKKVKLGTEKAKFSKKMTYLFLTEFLFSAFLAWFSYDFSVFMPLISDYELLFVIALFLMAFKQILLVVGCSISKVWRVESEG